MAAERAYAMAGIGPDADRLRRGARLLHDHRDPRHRGPRVRREGQGRRGVARGRDVAHRSHPGQHVRRPAGQGPPDRRDRCRADHRVLVAAAGRGRATARWSSATASRSSTTWAAAARACRSSTSSPPTADGRTVIRCEVGRRRRRAHHARPTRREERADGRDARRPSSTPCARAAPTTRCARCSSPAPATRSAPGMDLRGVDRGPGRRARLRRARTSEALRVGVQTFIRELWELDKPTVAAVNGAAVGPGAHLALACDFVLVHDEHAGSCGRSPSGGSSSTPAARTSCPASSACPGPRRW